MTVDINYWSEFYSTNHTLDASKFCLYVLEYLGTEKSLRILDAGCGNGRDSYALSKYHTVIGLDTAEYVPESTDKCFFETGDFCSYDKDVFDVIYSRFTLHSITDEQQIKFLSSITKKGTILCIECRSDRDINNFREHGDDHFRNFVNFDRLFELLNSMGFNISVAQEGNGFAPYKNENPFCVRFIAEKL